jgi:hypothetical protein
VADPVTGERPASAAKAVLVYNLARLALLGACLLIGWAAGLTGLWLIVAALAGSGVLSWFLLRKQRIGMGYAVEQTVEKGRARMAEHTAAEDAYADALARERQDPADRSHPQS